MYEIVSVAAQAGEEEIADGKEANDHDEERHHFDALVVRRDVQVLGPQHLLASAGTGDGAIKGEARELVLQEQLVRVLFLVNIRRPPRVVRP